MLVIVVPSSCVQMFSSAAALLLFVAAAANYASALVILPKNDTTLLKRICKNQVSVCRNLPPAVLCGPDRCVFRLRKGDGGFVFTATVRTSQRWHENAQGVAGSRAILGRCPEMYATDSPM
jgi:hypothetical protein